MDISDDTLLKASGVFAVAFIVGIFAVASYQEETSSADCLMTGPDAAESVSRAWMNDHYNVRRFGREITDRQEWGYIVDGYADVTKKGITQRLKYVIEVEYTSGDCLSVRNHLTRPVGGVR